MKFLIAGLSFSDICLLLNDLKSWEIEAKIFEESVVVFPRDQRELNAANNLAKSFTRADAKNLPAKLILAIA